jgi:hypothetical protein
MISLSYGVLLASWNIATEQLLIALDRLVT